MSSLISGIDTSSASTYTTSSSSSSTDLDKEAFLKLLVTQMQYQDPLDPGDSTEYMSQLAQYSALEATMNISDTVEKGNALNLVGQYVIMNTTDSAGNSSYVSGLVEYATVSNGEVLLSINDTYYNASDLDSVVDYDYYLYLQSQNSDSTDTSSDSTAQEETAADSGVTES
jgi:flagellar basal-body rod modification protein FlgD